MQTRYGTSIYPSIPTSLECSLIYFLSVAVVYIQCTIYDANNIMGFIPNHCQPRINPTRSMNHYWCLSCFLDCANRIIDSSVREAGD